MTIQQVGGRGDVVCFSAGQNEAQGPAFCIGEGVDFGLVSRGIGRAIAELFAAAGAKSLDVYGKVDVFVGNAATVAFSPLADVTPDEYQHTMDVNARGNLVMTQNCCRK